jgi:zinc transport system substrate-binding protein
MGSFLTDVRIAYRPPGDRSPTSRDEISPAGWFQAAAAVQSLNWDKGLAMHRGHRYRRIVTLLHYVMVQGNSPQTIEVSDMQDTISGRFGKALGIGCAVMMAMMALAGTPAAAASDKSHSHEAHKSDDIYRGYFEDSQIEARTLADWEGDWQSVYPYLVDRSLDPVLAHKAENGEKTLEEYRAYYQTGYKTDVERIVIDGDTFSPSRHRPEDFSTLAMTDFASSVEILVGQRAVDRLDETSSATDFLPSPSDAPFEEVEDIDAGDQLLVGAGNGAHQAWRR